MIPEFRTITLENGCRQEQYSEGSEAWIDIGEPICDEQDGDNDDAPLFQVSD